MNRETGYEAGSGRSPPSSSEISLSDSKPCDGSEGSPSYSQISFSDGQIEKKPCEICGSDANESKMMTCFKCQNTREHIYCARVNLLSVPPMWLCEECRGFNNPSSSRVIVLEIAEQTATSRIDNQVEEMEVNEDSIQSAQSSRINNQVEDNDNSMEAASASRPNNAD